MGAYLVKGKLTNGPQTKHARYLQHVRGGKRGVSLERHADGTPGNRGTQPRDNRQG